MKYFVIGGAGFIGSHLVDLLVTKGDVTVFDNMTIGKEEFLASANKVRPVNLVRADALDLDALKTAMKGHDVVFHLAANPEVRWGLERTRLDLEQGTIATYNALEAARLNGVKHFVFSSSGTVYGNVTEPCGEMDLGHLPISLYGASKFALTYFNKALLAETGDGPVKVCYLSPGIVLTDLLKCDMGSNDPRDWQRTQRVYNILADRVETVTPFLAEGILREQKAGARVAWLTGAKAAARFAMAPFRKRRLLTEADLAG